jgi:thiosulfate dehydrogenase (quinone) large subunit
MGEAMSKIFKLLKKSQDLVFNDSAEIPKVSTRYSLLAMQVLYGLLWLESSWWKIRINGKFALNYDGLEYWTRFGSSDPVFGPYKWLLDHLILPNMKLFLPVVFLSELTIGLLFIAGKKIRLAAVIAFAQTIAITLSVLNAPHEWKWTYFMLMMIAVIFFVMPTNSRWLTKSLNKK